MPLPFAAIAPSIITGGASLLGGIANIFGQKSANETNIENQWKLLKYQNEYNTPYNQVQRLKEAGLSPLTLNGSNSGSAAPTSASVQSPDYSALANAAQNGLQNYLNIKSLNADIDKKSAEADSIREGTKLTKEQTNQAKTFNEFYTSILTQQLKMNEVSMSFNESATKLNYAQAQKAYRECTQIDSNVEQINTNTRLLIEKIQEQRTTNKYLDRTLSVNIQKVLSDMHLNSQMARESAQRVANMILQGDQTALQNEILHLSYAYDFNTLNERIHYTNESNKYGARQRKLEMANVKFQNDRLLMENVNYAQLGFIENLSKIVLNFTTAINQEAQAATQPIKAIGSLIPFAGGK